MGVVIAQGAQIAPSTYKPLGEALQVMLCSERSVVSAGLLVWLCTNVSGSFEIFRANVMTQ